MNESPEERKKKKVRELLRCSTIFYHFIEYDFPDTLNNAVFNREKSVFRISKQPKITRNIQA